VKLWIYLALGVAALALLWGLYSAVREDAAENERAKQEKANAEFIIRTQNGRSTYDQCDAADGVYDFAAGTCKLPAARPSGSTPAGGERLHKD
jgi:hypothetical protein